MAVTERSPFPTPEELLPRKGSRRLLTPLGLGALVLVLTAGLHFRDPHQHGSWGLCPFKLLTGWDCPGCGGLRATNDLTQGHLGAAWHSHAFFVAAIPAIVGLWAWWVGAAASGRRAPATYPAVRVGAIVVALALAAFTIWRNTPWGHAFYA